MPRILKLHLADQIKRNHQESVALFKLKKKPSKWTTLIVFKENLKPSHVTDVQKAYSHADSLWSLKAFRLEANHTNCKSLSRGPTRVCVCVCMGRSLESDRSIFLKSCFSRVPTHTRHFPREMLLAWIRCFSCSFPACFLSFVVVVGVICWDQRTFSPFCEFSPA